ncbi:MAG: peptide deformylase [Clostridia bacterium]|nr:peptide deformylase [Clostridia bacterium]
MAIREIITKGNELLDKKCHKVTVFDRRMWTLLDDMKETLKDSGGVGLAAPQIGIMRRVFIMDDGEQIWEFINPEIIEASEYHEVPEGCLSVPGVQGMVSRPNYVKIRGMSRDSEPFEAEFTGLMAQCAQHENDHLDGILFDSKICGPIPEED